MEPSPAPYVAPLRSTAAAASSGSSSDDAAGPRPPLAAAPLPGPPPHRAAAAAADRPPPGRPTSTGPSHPSSLAMTPLAAGPSSSSAAAARQPPAPPPAPPTVFKAPGPIASQPSRASAAAVARGSKAGKGKSKALQPPKRQQSDDDDDDDDDEDDDDAIKPGGKKKRKRVERACYSCRQRRSKCDGHQPCAVCTHAKVECSYPPPPRRVSMKYVEELESKLRSLEGKAPTGSSDELPVKSSSASAGSSRRGSSSHAHLDAAGRPQLAPGGLPSIDRIGADDDGPSPYAGHSWPLGAGSPYGASVPSQLSRSAADGPASYRQQAHAHHDGSGGGGQAFPPAGQLPPYNLAAGVQGSTHHQLPPMADPHRFALPSPAYGSASHGRWEPSPLATLADLTTTQMRSSPRPSPFPTPLSSYAGGGSSFAPHGRESYPYSTQAGQPPSLPHLARHPIHPATPEYTPPMAEMSQSHPSESSGGGGGGGGVAHPGTLHRNLTASTVADDEHDGDGQPDADEEALKPVFEDAINRWERAGGDGKAADFVERAAARYTGKDIPTHSHAPEPGHTTDQSVVNALAPSPSTVDMFVLPPQPIADALVDFYYRRVQHIFPVLSWPVFHRQYTGAISGPEPQGGSRLRASEQIIRATIDLVLAISAALRCAPGDAAISANGFRRAQALVSVPHLLLMGNLPIIQYLLLLCFHSQSSSKGNLSANAAGLGLLMARGIQLDSREINESFAPKDARVRERVWFCALQMETTSSAMLYRSTTTTERDFDVLAPPSLIDDAGELIHDPLRLGNNEAPKPLGFFREICSLVAIKARVLRSLYMLQGNGTFPDSTIVLQAEEDLLNFWDAVPNYLKIKTAPDDTLYRLQAHILQCRYNNTRIMLYRPFLFHFCSTPGGTYPIPDSLRFNLARKSARVCLDCAVEQVDLVLSKSEEFMQGSFWFNLGHLYTSSLVLLAHRLVNMVWPSSDKDDVERLSVEALRRVMDYFVVLGWHSSEGLSAGDGPPTQPPPNAIKTARRVYRIVRTIDKVIKRPADVPTASDLGDPVKEPQPAVGPNRYARYPDPTVPPLHLAPPETIPFSDDAFMSSWISLMQPNYRDGDIVPVDFNPPVTPFDLSRQNLGTNTEGESNWQGWESLLGMGYFSNLMTDAAGGGSTDDMLTS